MSKEKDLILKNIKKISADDSKGEFIEKVEKRTDGRRLVRSVLPDRVSTADRPNIPVEGVD